MIGVSPIGTRVAGDRAMVADADVEHVASRRSAEPLQMEAFGPVSRPSSTNSQPWLVRDEAQPPDGHLSGACDREPGLPGWRSRAHRAVMSNSLGPQQAMRVPDRGVATRLATPAPSRSRGPLPASDASLRPIEASPSGRQGLPRAHRGVLCWPARSVGNRSGRHLTASKVCTGPGDGFSGDQGFQNRPGGHPRGRHSR